MARNKVVNELTKYDHTEVKKAFEAGMKVEYRDLSDHNVWTYTGSPCWDVGYPYRIKPLSSDPYVDAHARIKAKYNKDAHICLARRSEDSFGNTGIWTVWSSPDWSPSLDYVLLNRDTLVIGAISYGEA